MRKIHEILYSEQELDIVLVQPNFLMQILESEQNEIVREYWKSMNNSEPLGDTPNEPNHGLFSSAASLRKAGHTVDVLDVQAFDRFLRDLIMYHLMKIILLLLLTTREANINIHQKKINK